MVHIPAKFPENTSMRFQATVRKLNRTDRQTDGWTGALQYLPSRACGAAGDKNDHTSQFELMIKICFKYYDFGAV